MSEKKRRGTGWKPSHALAWIKARLAGEVEEEMKSKLKEEDWKDEKKVKKAFAKALGDIVGSEVPNRVQLRAAGMNIARTTGKSHARLSRARKTPASLYTLIAVRLPPGQDGTSKTIVVPRDKFERR